MEQPFKTSFRKLFVLDNFGENIRFWNFYVKLCFRRKDKIEWPLFNTQHKVSEPISYLELRSETIPVTLVQVVVPQ